MTSESHMVDLNELSDAAEPGPWSYRPLKYDDWGIIRSLLPADPFNDELGTFLPLVAEARPRANDHGYNYDAHRVAKTDPMKANADFIVAVVNAYRAGRLVEVEVEPFGEVTE